MSRIVRIFQVDAFTDTQFSGNPAGVVLDADELTDQEMQAIARELNNGDTAFVFAATGDDHDIGIRFFTPRKEAPFVGHATLAAHAVLSRISPQNLRRQKGRTGIVQVQTLSEASGFSIRQPAPPLGRTISSGELDQVLSLLGLTREQLANHPARIAGSASTRLLLCVRDSHALDAMQPQLAALGSHSAELGAQGYFIFTHNPDALPGVDTEARMFCPALGIDEDPVSGNAHAMLGVYLVEHGMLEKQAGNAQFTGAQGRHVARPGRVAVSVELDAAGKPLTATIAGNAVVVFEATLRL